ncbi:choice-of-anchor M domain-containing protein [Streptomyces sp. NPDC127092]|uniref:choice-of-anchor M domain-containing protein n=1 Tax=Streptomyces sp. NPDC127092 TaxID=3347135 RepID=UPI00366A0FE3
MRLARNTRVALAAAGALTLAGTAATAPPPAPAAPSAEASAAPRAEGEPLVALLGADRRALGTDGVIDVDDSHRTTGPDGAPLWRFEPSWETTGTEDGATVRWSLTELTGPGSLRVTDATDAADATDTTDATDTGVADATGTAPPSSAAPPAVRFDSADGLPDAYELRGGEQGRIRWEFDAPGTYAVVLTAETAAGTDGGADGAQGTSPRRTEARYTVRVGGPAGTATPLPPHAPAPGQAPAAPAAGPVAAPVTAQVRTAPRAAAAAVPAERAETGRKVLDEGHVDIAARVVDGRLQVQVKDGTVPGRTVWREPSSLVLHVKPQARRTIPAAKDFAFLGKAGEPVWLLDQVQQPGLLWPGWSTDNLPAGATRGEVSFTLAKAEGPGTFALYNYDGLSGATVRFNSADGVPDTFGIPQNTHAHGGWAFGKEGVYRLTLTMSATLADGTRTSDTETLAFAVGAVDPATVPTGGSGGETGGGGTGGATGGPAGDGATGGSGGKGPDTTGSGSGSGGTGGSGGPGGSGGTGGTGGSMASTGAGSTALLTGTAAALAAAGAGAVALARRRRA